MMIPAFVRLVVMPVRVSATFRLESCLDFLQTRSETAEHIFNYVVRSNAKDLFSNFSRQVSIAQVPGKAHQLSGILVPDFDNILRSGLDL
jgi:hypothetical protein